MAYAPESTMDNYASKGTKTLGERVSTWWRDERASRLTIGYVYALCMVALLIGLSHLLVIEAIKHQEGDAAVINLSGRQRMLSQQLSKQALLLERATSAEERGTRLGTLAEAHATWYQVHLGLQYGDEARGLSGDNSFAVLALYTAIEPSFRGMNGQVEAILAGGTSDNVSLLVQEADAYLVHMDRIVFQNELEARARVASQLRLQNWVLIALFSLLALEALLIFRPLVSGFRRAYANLAESNEQLRKERQELRRVTREREDLLQQKDELTAIASHDLRSPLSIIQGYAQLIHSRMEKNKPIGLAEIDLVRRVIRQSKVMAGIIDRFLEFQALQLGGFALQQTRVELNEIVTEMAENLQERAASKKIALSTDLDSSLPAVRVDGARIEQVLGNLVENALKYCEDGCCVIVRTRYGDLDVVCEVEDNGPGMCAEDLEQAFSRYSHIQRKAGTGEKSFGLGLSICKQLVELNEGQIGVRNNPLRGVTFWFSLPRAEQSVDRLITAAAG